VNVGAPFTASSTTRACPSLEPGVATTV
jgi:hypothetical protein